VRFLDGVERGYTIEGVVSAMSNVAKTVEIPEDLQAFVDERIRSGHGRTEADVVRDALEEKRRKVLHSAIDAGMAELDAGLGVECTPDELMAEAQAEAGLDEP
jgi:predicted transcriptional regulator